MRALSATGREMIKRFEGLRLTAYPDGEGYSIGYGHHGASPGETITKPRAEELFEQDVARFESAVNRLTPVTTQPQFDALVSFTYNVGEGSEASGKGLAGSTLRRKHNAGDYAGAAAEFGRWIHSKGKPNAVLKARRETERALYVSGQHATPPLEPPRPPPPLEPPRPPPPLEPPMPPPPLVAGVGATPAGWVWVLVPAAFFLPARAVTPGDAGAGETAGGSEVA